jgi:uncharacterized protein (TIGR02271 family)
MKEIRKMPTSGKHEHPGGDVPHKHSEGDELAVHDSQSTSRDTSGKTLELREEQLQARKQPVETGRVSIGKEVVEEKQTLEVPVTHEEVTIERQAVARRPAEGSIGEKDETIRVPVREEQVSVDKQAVVTEEVRVGKQQIQETKQVSGTVRREEARIEGDGDIDVKRS